jgi:2',3'-cyclic-nucleotide 2'-phosphodiesterase
MRILLVGDVCGEPGRRCIQQLIPRLRKEHELDLVVINGENASQGLGLGERAAKQMLGWGVDGITLGNHAFRQRDILGFLNESSQIIRPANMSSRAPGKGLMFIEGSDGQGGPNIEVAVLNLMGSLYLEVAASPFEVVDRYIEQAKARTPIVLVDMHAEATSEKVAMGQHLKGRVSAVVGTHTHVQTSDARILAGGTAYITDLGMTGPHDSVIGMRTDIILKKFTTGLGQRFEPATGGVQLEGAIVEVDTASGTASSIEAIRVPLAG